jgi:Tudor domain
MVAALKNGLWYRGEIKFVSDNDALVWLVDFGKSEYIKSADLRHLEKKFVAPCRKACKGSLAGIKPKGESLLWDFDAIKAFLLEVKGRNVFATVKSFHNDTFRLSIVTDVFSRVRVADKLINNKFVEKAEDADDMLNAILVC